jgi:hypothetical protein
MSIHRATYCLLAPLQSLNPSHFGYKARTTHDNYSSSQVSSAKKSDDNSENLAAGGVINRKGQIITIPPKSKAGRPPLVGCLQLLQ